MNLTVLSSLPKSTEPASTVADRDRTEGEGNAFGDVFGALVANTPNDTRKGETTVDTFPKASEAIRETRDDGPGKLPAADGAKTDGDEVAMTKPSQTEVSVGMPVESASAPRIGFKDDPSRRVPEAKTSEPNVSLGQAPRVTHRGTPEQVDVSRLPIRNVHADHAQTKSGSNSRVILQSGTLHAPISAGPKTQANTRDIQNGNAFNSTVLPTSDVLRHIRSAPQFGRTDAIDSAVTVTSVKMTTDIQPSGLAIGTSLEPGRLGNRPRRPNHGGAEGLGWDQRPLPGFDNKTRNISKPKDVAQLSMLERHLGGHAPTLIANARDGERPNFVVSGPIKFEDGIQQPRLAQTSAISEGQSDDSTRTGMQPKGLPLVPIKVSAGPPTFGQDKITGDTSPLLSQAVDEMGFDLRPTLSITGATANVHAPRNDMATSVAHQIAEAVRRTSDKSVEIALNPVELGRVRMVLSASDAGITVNILADRQDTLDLMRRNIDDLGKSFADMGYEDISFSFGQGDQAADDASENKPDPSVQNIEDIPSLDTPTAPGQLSSRLAIAPDGIDMRF